MSKFIMTRNGSQKKRLEVVVAYLILFFTGKKELQKEIQMGSRQVYYRKQREGLAVHREVRAFEVCP